MNLTLTALTAAVVTACFVTAGAKDERPVFPVSSVESSAHLETLSDKNVRSAFTVSSVESGAHVELLRDKDKTTDFPVFYVESSAHVEEAGAKDERPDFPVFYVESNAHVEAVHIIKEPDLTVSANSKGYITIFSQRIGLSYLENSATSLGDTQAHSKHVDETQTDTLSSCATIEAWGGLEGGFYNFQYMRAYYKADSSKPPYSVIGYYNKVVIFGSAININARNLANTMTSESAIEILGFVKLPNQIESVASEVGNIQTHVKNSKAEGDETLSSTLVARDPSNISPYRTAKNLKDILTSSVDFRTPLTLDSRIEGLQHNIITQGVLKMAPYKLISEHIEVVSEGVMGAFAKDSRDMDVSVSLVSALGNNLNHVVQGAPKQQDDVTSSMTALVVIGASLATADEIEVLNSFGRTSLFSIAPYNAVHVISSAASVLPHARHNRPEGTNVLTSTGQTDLRYGEANTVERTEELHTVLENIKLVHNPGVDSVSNNLLTEVISRSVAGRTAQVPLTTEAVNTSAILNLQPYKLSGGHITSLASAFDLLTFKKEATASGVEHTANSSGDFSFILAKPVFTVASLISNHGMLYLAKDGTAKSLLDSTVSENTITIIYKDPIEITGVSNTVVSAFGPVSIYQIGPYTHVYNIVSELPNIQTRVKYAPAFGEHTLTTTAYLSQYVSKMVNYKVDELATVGTVSLVPYYLATALRNTLATEFVLSAHQEANEVDPVAHAAITYLNDLRIVNGLRLSISGNLDTLVTSKGIQLTVDRVGNALLNRSTTALGSTILIAGDNKTETSISEDLSTSMFIEMYKSGLATEVIESLVSESGALMRAKDEAITTPLHTAVTSGQTDLHAEHINILGRTEEAQTMLGDVALHRDAGVSYAIDTVNTYFSVSYAVGERLTATASNSLSSSHSIQVTPMLIVSGLLHQTQTNLGSILIAVGEDISSNDNKNFLVSGSASRFFKEQVLKNTLNTTVTSNVTRIFALHGAPLPLNTLATTGQTDVHAEHINIIGRTETTVTALGSIKLVKTPSVNNALNTGSTTNVTTIAIGKNNTATRDHMVESSFGLKTAVDYPATVSGDLISTGVVTTYVKHHSNSSLSTTAVTTNYSTIIVRHINMSGRLNTTTTALGGAQYSVVHPVTLTLDKQGGTGGTNSITTIAGFSITPASVTPPTRAHFTFNGYYTLAAGGTQVVNSSGAYVALTNSTYMSPITLYAQWTDVVYTITWKSYSNVTLKTDNLIYASTSTAPTGTTDTAQYDYSWPKASTSVTGNETIKETRATKSYTITWKAYSGATLKSETLLYGATSTAPTGTSDTAQYDYAWPKSSTTVAGAETITETRSTKSYTVTWYKYGQSGETYAKRETLLYGATSTAATGTTDTAQYQYDWPKASTTVTGTENITETRTLLSYTITWYKYGQSGETYAKRQTLTYGSTSTAPTGNTDTAQYDYSWPKTSTTVVGTEAITETRTTKSYTVTWKSYTNVTLKSETLDYGSTSTAPIGTSDTTSYDYSWPKSSTTVVGAETITETRVGQPYTVTFNGNGGGTPSPTSKGVVYNNTYGTLATVSRTNWAFLGWFTAASGGTKRISSDTMSTTSNHTLYAHWNPTVASGLLHTMVTTGQSDVHVEHINIIGRTESTVTALGGMQYENQTVFTITLNRQGGTGGTSTITGLTDVSITPTSITPPTRANYTFTGYWTATSGGTKYINANGSYNNLDSNVFVGPATLYAQWTMSDAYFDWNPTPSTIGLLADISVGDVVQQANSADWYQARAANATFKVSNLTIPAGWAYSSYSTTNLVNIVTAGSGATTEVQGDGNMAQTSARAIAITVVGNTYNITVAQNGGTGSSASISTYQPKTTATSITMTRGTYTNFRFHSWTLSGANGQATVSGNTVTIPTYTTSVKPYGALTITANWKPATTTALNTVVSALGDAQYAVATPFTITLDKQSGTGGTSSIVCVNSFYLNPTSATAPTRSGYTFGGYFTGTGGTGTQRINSSGTFVGLTNTTYTSAVTLYAHWTTVTYTLTNNRNNGTGGNNSATYNILTSSTIATLLGTVTRSGYTFSAWRWISSTAGGWTNGTDYASSTNVLGKYATGTLQAQWTANPYTVTFNANGGTTPSPTSKSVTYASTYGALATTSKTDYIFVGWFTAATGGSKIITSTTVTTAGAHTLYAHWKPTVTSGLVTLITALGDMQTSYELPTYSITTSSGTGVASMSVSPTTYQESGASQNITISRSASTGFTLNAATITRLGTYGGSTPTVSGTTVSIPAASWGPFRVNQTASGNSFSITLNPNTGASGSITSISVVYNTSITSFSSNMIPIKTGYTFNGFYTATSAGTRRISSSAYVALTQTTYTSAATLYAQWTAIQSTVTFNANNGGTPSPTTKVVTYGSTYGTLATVSRTGYTFNGWFTASSGGTQILSSTSVTITAAQVLYAQWTGNSFTITLDANGGTTASNSAISVTYGTSIEAFNINMRPTRAGYLFKGYYTVSSGGTLRVSPTEYFALNSTTYSSATTLYAQWDSAPNFPTVRMASSGSITTAALSMTVSLPSYRVAGDLLIIGVVLDGSRTLSAPSGWTQLANPTNSSNARHTVWYKVCGASESNPVITWTTTSELGTWYSIGVTAGTWSGTPEIFTQYGSTATPTIPGSLTPTWGYAKTLWLHLFGWDTNKTSSTSPSGTTLMTYQAGSSTLSAGHRTFRRDSESASSTLTSITLSASAIYYGHTIGVAPGIVGGATSNPTVGTPYCADTGGGNTVYVSVTNNDSSTVTVYMNGVSKGTIAGGGSATIAYTPKVNLPLGYNIDVYVLASGKTASDIINKTGTITICSIM